MGEGKRPKRRILILGDSITHGGEGDYTWRYRLWEWFQQHKIDADFVGPYTGVNRRDEPVPPQPPRLPGEYETPPKDRIPWGYNVNVSHHFDSSHFATWGYQAKQATSVIGDAVRQSNATMLLSLVGFNDLGWFVNDANGTMKSIETILQECRKANPTMEFVFGNVVQRSKMDGRQDLIDNTNLLNKLLKTAASDWNSTKSPVSYADVASLYECGPEYGERCPAAYDGLHPNALGEYQIAKAFSNALHTDFALGERPVEIPTWIPARDLRAPSHIVVEGAPMGLAVTWKHVFGAEYDYRRREKGQSKWSEHQIATNRADLADTNPGTGYEVQIRSRHGYENGSWSDSCSAIATRDTAPPPRNIKVFPANSSFSISWDPPAGHWNIERYEILWADQDVQGFPSNQGARGNATVVHGLTNGHRIQAGMRTWTRSSNGLYGGGEYAFARPLRLGVGSPQRPSHLEARRVDDRTIDLSWRGRGSNAGYLIYLRNVSEASDVATTDGQVVADTSKTVAVMFGNIWDFEISVSAINGEEESQRSAGLVPEKAERSCRRGD
ncbi:hypothetical protein AC578_2897 [Pseudocercospora eumusae]|uniref:Fibronectin type-III domain-containing protein n=1 Tax=Pseudocercospora eumusae TaxID=321146 RepID=A0A139H3S7_9PEZI|nr:hypothetical protein AC578_2897 [Pseudocercospora eumusae]